MPITRSQAKIRNEKIDIFEDFEMTLSNIHKFVSNLDILRETENYPRLCEEAKKILIEHYSSDYTFTNTKCFVSETYMKIFNASIDVK